MAFNTTLFRNANLSNAMSGYYEAGDAPAIDWEVTDLVATPDDPDDINLTWTANDTVDVQWFPPPSLGGIDWQTIAFNLTSGSYTHTPVTNSNDDNSYRLKHIGELVYSNNAYANTSPLAGESPSPEYVNRTHLVTTAASGGGDGSEGDPWTLQEAMTNAVAGNIVGIQAGIYVGSDPGAGAGNRYTPAFRPANAGTISNLITFVAENLASVSSTGFTDIRSGATVTGSGWAAYGSLDRKYIQWIGMYSNNQDSNNKMLNDSAPVTLWNCDGSKVSYNTLIGEDGMPTDNYSGIRVENSDNIEIANTLIHSFDDPSVRINKTGVIVYKSNSLTIHNNEIRDNGAGIQLKTGPISDFNFYENKIYSNGQAFRFHGVQDTVDINTMRNNLIYNNDFVWESTTAAGTPYTEDLRVYNNVFYNNTSSDPAAIWTAFSPSTRDNQLFNNIFHTAGAYFGTYQSATLQDAADFIQGDRNVFYNLTQFMNGSPSNSPEIDTATLGDWQALGRDINSITTDPLFVSLESDFSLQGGSPALTLGRDNLGTYGPVDAVIPAGAYVTGSEIIGIS